MLAFSCVDVCVLSFVIEVGYLIADLLVYVFCVACVMMCFGGSDPALCFVRQLFFWQALHFLCTCIYLSVWAVGFGCARLFRTFFLSRATFSHYVVHQLTVLWVAGYS